MRSARKSSGILDFRFWILDFRLIQNQKSKIQNTFRGSRSGVTLIELLVTIIIGAIAMMALSAPFMAERIFWLSGDAQAESQRDAQLVLRAIARAGRQADRYTPGFTSGPPGQVTTSGMFETGTVQMCFMGGPAIGNGSLRMGDKGDASGCSGTLVTLIDGTRSRVQSFSMTPIVPNKLIRVQLEVIHTSGSRQENEIVETEIFLRNG